MAGRSTESLSVMRGTVAAQPHSKPHQIALAAACVVHAILIAVYWWASWAWDIANTVPGAIWLALFWAWFAWPMSLFIFRELRSRAAIMAVILGGGLIVPTLFTAALSTMQSFGWRPA